MAKSGIQHLLMMTVVANVASYAQAQVRCESVYSTKKAVTQSVAEKKSLPMPVLKTQVNPEVKSIEKMSLELERLIKLSETRNVDLDIIQLISLDVQPSILRLTKTLSQSEGAATDLLKGNRNQLSTQKILDFAQLLNQYQKTVNPAQNLYGRLKFAIPGLLKKETAKLTSKIVLGHAEILKLRTELEHENTILVQFQEALRGHRLEISEQLQALAPLAERYKNSDHPTEKLAFKEIVEQMQELQRSDANAQGLMTTVASVLDQNRDLYKQANKMITNVLPHVATKTVSPQLLKAPEPSAAPTAMLPAPKAKENLPVVEAPKSDLSEQEASDYHRLKMIILTTHNDGPRKMAFDLIQKKESQYLLDLLAELSNQPYAERLMTHFLEFNHKKKWSLPMESTHDLLISQVLENKNASQGTLTALGRYLETHELTAAQKQRVLSVFLDTNHYSNVNRKAALEGLTSFPSLEILTAIAEVIPREKDHNFVTTISGELLKLERRLPATPEYQVWREALKVPKTAVKVYTNKTAIAQNNRELKGILEEFRIKFKHHELRKDVYAKTEKLPHLVQGEVLIRILEESMRLQAKSKSKHRLYEDEAMILLKYREQIRMVLETVNEQRMNKWVDTLHGESSQGILGFLLFEAAHTQNPIIRKFLESHINQRSSTERLSFLAARMIHDKIHGSDITSSIYQEAYRPALANDFSKIFEYQNIFSEDMIIQLWKYKLMDPYEHSFGISMNMTMRPYQGYRRAELVKEIIANKDNYNFEPSFKDFSQVQTPDQAWGMLKDTMEWNLSAHREFTWNFYLVKLRVGLGIEHPGVTFFLESILKTKPPAGEYTAAELRQLRSELKKYVIEDN